MAEQGLSAQQCAYLEAMGIDVLVSREAAAPVAEVAVMPEPAAPVTEATVMTEATLPAPEPAAADTELRWQGLRQAVARCTQCRLHETRTQSVFGVGPRDARLMVIGEAPGAEEDRTGEPFVGRAGHMLDAMLRAIGCDRDTVFIANTIKCRPPGNRDPRVDEVTACNDYLEQQLTAVAPDVVIAVGRIAAQRLLQVDMPLGRMRGKTHQLPDRDVPLVVTYHPAYLLREPAQKARAWEDLKRVRALLESAS
ncbi:MAG: uracil-DNA glycosylase [Pseudomonadota bacterium]